MSLIHIVFGQSNIPNLQAAIEMESSLAGEIMSFEDDLSVGPVFILDTNDGKEARTQWWNEIYDVAPAAPTLLDETEAPVQAQPPADPVKALKQKLKEDEELHAWIWAGQNASDVCGYFWLISQLDAFSGRIHIIYLNNLPFLNEKGGVFYPTHLHQILPKEFLKARKLARPVSLAEFELDGDEWRRLMNENAGIRLLEGGKKLRGEPATFYDKDLLQQGQKDFIKASRVISQMTGKLKFPIPEQFLCWRLKELVKQEKLVSRGELKTMRDFDVKQPGGNDANVTEN
ncbi:uncharacterized protein DUF3658 [Chitinophaga skermanii]|uniref:Uncharacterized protein DUF3658 n=1 Tax=Chitinophaga skermanii TaxID=331697 RepID=A0A327QYT4_9BACT|nr:DUF1835 domain-containing protein [Chitinophaga skermanii]RAJ06817.1 uncharacterized protein DUF3658 [Chitinophaga skermanii]